METHHSAGVVPHSVCIFTSIFSSIFSSIFLSERHKQVLANVDSHHFTGPMGGTETFADEVDVQVRSIFLHIIC